MQEGIKVGYMLRIVVNTSHVCNHHWCCAGREPQDFEEGEIRAADLDMKRSKSVHWSLTWALYETLHGQTPKALSALQAALETADGNMHVGALARLKAYLCSRLLQTAIRQQSVLPLLLLQLVYSW